jgi:hypothetical protein
MFVVSEAEAATIRADLRLQPLGGTPPATAQDGHLAPLPFLVGLAAADPDAESVRRLDQVRDLEAQNSERRKAPVRETAAPASLGSLANSGQGYLFAG